jgi:hypothetical protein
VERAASSRHEQSALNFSVKLPPAKDVSLFRDVGEASLVQHLRNAQLCQCVVAQLRKAEKTESKEDSGNIGELQTNVYD